MIFAYSLGPLSLEDPSFWPIVMSNQCVLTSHNIFASHNPITGLVPVFSVGKRLLLTWCHILVVDLSLGGEEEEGRTGRSGPRSRSWGSSGTGRRAACTSCGGPVMLVSGSGVRRLLTYTTRGCILDWWVCQQANNQVKQACQVAIVCSNQNN